MPPLPPVHRLLFSYPSVWKIRIHFSFFSNNFHWLSYSEIGRSYIILKQELLTFHYGLLSSPFQYPSPEPKILQCNLQSAIHINVNQSTLLIDSVLNLLNILRMTIFWQSHATCFTSNLKLKNRAPTTMADRSKSRDCMAKNIALKTFLWEHSATNSQSLHPWFYKNISNSLFIKSYFHTYMQVTSQFNNFERAKCILIFFSILAFQISCE